MKKKYNVITCDGIKLCVEKDSDLYVSYNNKYGKRPDHDQGYGFAKVLKGVPIATGYGEAKRDIGEVNVLNSSFGFLGYALAGVLDKTLNDTLQLYSDFDFSKYACDGVRYICDEHDVIEDVNLFCTLIVSEYYDVENDVEYSDIISYIANKSSMLVTVDEFLDVFDKHLFKGDEDYKLHPLEVTFKEIFPTVYKCIKDYNKYITSTPVGMLKEVPEKNEKLKNYGMKYGQIPNLLTVISPRVMVDLMFKEMYEKTAVYPEINGDEVLYRLEDQPKVISMQEYLYMAYDVQYTMLSTRRFPVESEEACDIVQYYGILPMYLRILTDWQRKIYKKLLYSDDLDMIRRENMLDQCDMLAHDYIVKSGGDYETVNSFLEVATFECYFALNPHGCMVNRHILENNTLVVMNNPIESRDEYVVAELLRIREVINNSDYENTLGQMWVEYGMKPC